MITLIVNERTVELNDGSTLLDAAREAGVYIPTLCYHPRLPCPAVCQLCLVNVEGEARPQPACITKAKEGDVVETDSKDLQEFRNADIEWLLARHPNDCMRCEVNGACQLQNFVSENQLEDRWEKVPRGSAEHPEYSLTDHTSPSIWRDLSKCIECGLRVEACSDAGQQQYVIGFAERGAGRLPVTVFDHSLADTNCISCGQCTLVCPVGALIETPHWHDVLHTPDARRRVSAVQVAPATRIAISEEFGMNPGTVSTGKMINALRKLGFDYVFDTNFGAKFAEGKVEPHVVSVMPCTAKKDEAVRPGVAGDLDHVLTMCELARMIRARGIAFSTLSEEGEFDHPLGESTGAGQIFVASGGVMEAVVRTASHFIGEDGYQKACSGNLVIKADRVF